VLSGEALPEQWGETSRAVDFFDIKGDVERLFAIRGGSDKPEFEPGDLPWMHPGASALIKLRGELAGWCGALHPSVCKAFDIKKNVFAFEIVLERLLEREIPFAKSISRFPSVRRDLALLLTEGTCYSEVEKCITEVAGPLLDQVIVFDVYQGSNLKENCKSLAIGLIFNNVSSTLTDEDVDPVINVIVSELDHRLGAKLRG
jgi:phenylalanyl-tRNA synthetase beta chain